MQSLNIQLRLEIGNLEEYVENIIYVCSFYSSSLYKHDYYNGITILYIFIHFTKKY